MNDKDRDILKDNDLEIAQGTTDNLFEEQFNIYKAFTTAEEKLYLSFSSSNIDGSTLRPSIMIAKIKKIFPNLKEESDIIKKRDSITNVNATFDNLLDNIRKRQNGEFVNEIWNDVYNWYNNDAEWKEKLTEKLKALDYSNKAELIKSDNLDKLYGNTLKTSISKLEQYRNCPFSFHLKYGLKLKEQEEYKINAIDTGSFIHEVIDEYFQKMEEKNDTSEVEMRHIIEQIIAEKLALDKYYLFSSSAKFITLINRLKKTIIEAIKYIVYQIECSDFKVVGHEEEFVRKFDNVELIGKIDRVDIGKKDNIEYVRIIDYKSSDKNIDLNQVVAGTQIQLLTYIDSMTEEQNKEPAGILYFNILEPILNTNKNLSDEEIEEEIKQSFRMNGLILADVKVVKMMDKTLEKGSSSIIPAYIDKEGNLSNAKSNTITKEQFINLKKMIKKLITQISKEITSGIIDIKPIYNKSKKIAACKYCQYNCICGFNPLTDQYTYLENKSKELILDEIKKDFN